jgi:hypothetical protein
VELDMHNRWMVGFSLLFVLVTGLCTHWLGSVGFIVANAVNMVLRAGRSVVFINAYVALHRRAFAKQAHPLDALVPSGMVWASFGLSLAATLASQAHFLPDLAAGGPFPLRGAAAHVGVGLAGLLLVALALFAEVSGEEAEVLFVCVWKGFHGECCRRPRFWVA